MSAPASVLNRQNSLPPNEVQGGRVVSASELRQQNAARQQAARQAEIDRQQQAEIAKQQQAQQAKQQVRHRKANPNVFFNPNGGGWDFVIKPTYDDPTGSRPVAVSDINPDFLALAKGSPTKTDTASYNASVAVNKQIEDATKSAISQSQKQQEADLFGANSSNPYNVFNLAKQGINDVTYRQDKQGFYDQISYAQPSIKISGESNSLFDYYRQSKAEKAAVADNYNAFNKWANDIQTPSGYVVNGKTFKDKAKADAFADRLVSNQTNYFDNLFNQKIAKGEDISYLDLRKAGLGKDDALSFLGNYKAALNQNSQVGAADFPILTPASGFKKNNVFEGFDTYGEKTTLIISTPKVDYKTESVSTHAPEPTGGVLGSVVDFGKGAGENLKSYAAGFIDFFGKPSTKTVAKLYKIAPSDVGFVPENAGTSALFNLKATKGEAGAQPNAGAYLIHGRRVSGQTVDASGFADIGKEIARNPAYAAGSLAVTAASLISPDKYVKVGKGIFEGLKGGGAAIKGGEALELAKGATEINGIKIADKENIFVQPAKLTKSATTEEILSTPLKGSGFQSSKNVIGWIGAKPIVVPKIKNVVPDLYEVFEGAKSKNPELIGAVNAKTGKVEFGKEALDTKTIQQLTSQQIKTPESVQFYSKELKSSVGLDLDVKGVRNIKTPNLKANEVTQVYQSFGTGKDVPKRLTSLERFKSESLISQNPLENVSGAKKLLAPVNVKRQSELTGSIVGINAKDIRANLAAVKNEISLQKAAKSLLDEKQLKKAGKSKGFDFKPENVLKGVAPKDRASISGEGLAVSDFVLKGKSSKIANDLIRENIFKANQESEKGGAFYVPVGALGGYGFSGYGKRAGSIGGFAGYASKRRRSNQIIDSFSTEIEVIRYPKGSPKLNVKNLENLKTDNILSSLTGSNNRLIERTKPQGKSELNNVLKSLSASKFDLGAQFKNVTKQGGVELLKPAQANKALTGTRSSLVQNVKFENAFRQETTTRSGKRITERNTFRLTFPKSAFKIKPVTGRKGKKGKQKLQEFNVKDLVSVVGGENSQLAKQFAKAFKDLY